MSQSDRISRPMCFGTYRKTPNSMNCLRCALPSECVAEEDRLEAQLHAYEAAQANQRASDQPIKKRAPDFLQAALGHMQDRAKTYDKPQGERSMEATVAAFNAITGHELTEQDGWMLMICLKAVRSRHGKFRADSFEDGAAYFGLMGESAIRAQEMEQ